MLTDRWWEEPLASDIHESLQEKEKSLSTYRAVSPQLISRRALVDWVAVICDDIKICVNARHLAIHLLDYFMDNFDIGQDKLQLVAFGCILVSCKFEEIECSIPRWKQLNDFLECPGYSSMEYLQMELMILEYFRWNVMLPTASHFGPYYFVVSMLDDDCSYANVEYRKKAYTYMEKYLNYFLEISLQDHLYRIYLPSLIAAGCVAASRLCVRIAPTWPLCIEKVTSYSWDQVSLPVDFMLKALNADEAAATSSKKHGDSTSTTSPASISSDISLGSDGMCRNESFV